MRRLVLSYIARSLFPCVWLMICGIPTERRISALSVSEWSEEKSMSLKLSRTAFLNPSFIGLLTDDSCRGRRSDPDASFSSSSKYTCWAYTLRGNPFRKSRSSRTTCNSYPASPLSERRRGDASIPTPCPSKSIPKCRSMMWDNPLLYINDNLQHLLNRVEKLQFSLIDYVVSPIPSPTQSGIDRICFLVKIIILAIDLIHTLEDTAPKLFTLLQITLSTDFHLPRHALHRLFETEGI